MGLLLLLLPLVLLLVAVLLPLLVAVLLPLLVVVVRLLLLVWLLLLLRLCLLPLLLLLFSGLLLGLLLSQALQVCDNLQSLHHEQPSKRVGLPDTTATAAAAADAAAGDCWYFTPRCAACTTACTSRLSSTAKYTQLLHPLLPPRLDHLPAPLLRLRFEWPCCNADAAFGQVACVCDT
jgi:energy-coupling factor transporter transmembrane protein EcfT